MLRYALIQGSLFPCFDLLLRAHHVSRFVLYAVTCNNAEFACSHHKNSFLLGLLVGSKQLKTSTLSVCKMHPRNADTHCEASEHNSVNLPKEKAKRMLLVLQKDLVPTCRELGIAFLAYSPLGRGMLTGTFALDSLSPIDFRRHASPRFSKEAMQQVRHTSSCAHTSCSDYK